MGCSAVMMVLGILLMVLSLAAVICACLAGGAWCLMWAWNVALAGLLHWPTITFTQALAVYVVIGVVGGIFRRTVIVRHE